MEQDIAVSLMLLQIQHEGNIDFHAFEYLKKYLHLMYGVGFDAGRKNVYARYSKKKTPVIQRDRDNNRIAQYESVALAAKSTAVSTDTIFEAMKRHWLTKDGYYWERVA
jgi:hypothetical protein